MALLVAVDGLIGGVAAGVSASMSGTLSANQAVPLLCLIGLLFWPAAVGSAEDIAVRGSVLALTSSAP